MEGKEVKLLWEGKAKEWGEWRPGNIYGELNFFVVIGHEWAKNG